MFKRVFWKVSPFLVVFKHDTNRTTPAPFCGPPYPEAPGVSMEDPAPPFDAPDVVRGSPKSIGSLWVKNTHTHIHASAHVGPARRGRMELAGRRAPCALCALAGRTCARNPGSGRRNATTNVKGTRNTGGTPTWCVVFEGTHLFAGLGETKRKTTKLGWSPKKDTPITLPPLHKFAAYP